MPVDAIDDPGDDHRGERPTPAMPTSIARFAAGSVLALGLLPPNLAAGNTWCALLQHVSLAKGPTHPDAGIECPLSRTDNVSSKEPKVQRTVTIHIDDLDGRQIRSATGGTVLFSLDGVAYEIDLSAKHRRELEKALDPYIAAGRKLPK